jgi:hypothetical protein
MAEIQIGPGDSVSRLLQLRAQRLGIRMIWSGKGVDDMDQLCTDYANKKLLNECLWNGMKELMAMVELKELPEPVQAKIASIVLKAQAVFELGVGDRQKKLEPKPPGAAA